MSWLIKKTRKVALELPLCLMFSFANECWSVSPSHQAARDELSYGTVLYELYQRDFFNALVNDAWVRGQSNPYALSADGRLLQGGMQLSYGLPSSSENIFLEALNDSQLDLIRNTAWFYLAKLYHAKSDIKSAQDALGRVRGDISENVRLEYHYLNSLFGDQEFTSQLSRESLDQVKDDLPEYPYIIFNFAIEALERNDIEQAKKFFTDVQSYNHLGEEYEILSDRSKHALFILASHEGDLAAAWELLSQIRTTGLYSNRAILSYAWTAIKLKRYKEAIPALKILDGRSIALPEVQEGKVLLAHLYEQDKSPRKALKQNIIAEKEFRHGLAMLDEAERIIEMKDVPKEFIANLENVVSETDWYGERPEVDYKQLTPFLIDLLAAHNFNESLRELSDLYAIKENIEYWMLQGEQHLLILAESLNKRFDGKTELYIKNSDELKTKLLNLDMELRLMLLSLEQAQQDKFETQLKSIERQLQRVDERLNLIKSIENPYVPPAHLAPLIAEKQDELREQLTQCEALILRLEKIVRGQVKNELARHRSRMTYYSAQARLAKARLYDATLQDLNRAKKQKSDETEVAGEQVEE